MGLSIQTLPVLRLMLLAALLFGAGAAAADERRHSGEDTSRHPRRDDGQAYRPPPRLSAGRRSYDDPLVGSSPAERQYWSDRCVQQRARGWGSTGDCDSPAYTGGYDRRPRFRPYREYRYDGEPRYRPRSGLSIESRDGGYPRYDRRYEGRHEGRYGGRYDRHDDRRYDQRRAPPGGAALSGGTGRR